MHGKISSFHLYPSLSLTIYIDDYNAFALVLGGHIVTWEGSNGI